MLQNPPILHLLCGKIASGKSTLATELAKAPGTVIIAEDEWLAALFGDEMSSISDYANCSRKLRQVMGPHVVRLLKAGLSVVLDYQANTIENRNWMRSMFEAANACHQLHYLDVPDAVCKKRLQARNAAGSHEFAASDEQFDTISAYFVAPAPAENFTTITHAHRP